MESNQSIRTDLVKAIQSPLGFYVLSLLIVEGFIASVLIFSDLDSVKKYDGFLVGVYLFILVVVIVSIFSWFKPHNLTYDGHAHLIDSGKVPWGTESNPVKETDIDNAKKGEDK